jgi:hypothetical protein
MRIKHLVSLFLVFGCALHAQQAEAERAKIESLIRSPAMVEVREIDRWALPDNIDRATVDERLKRLRGEWVEFLRSKTEAGKDEDHRTVKSAVLWAYIFNGGGDDAAGLVDKQTQSTLRLSGVLKAAALRVELEPDAALRAKMSGRISSALADLEVWRKQDVNSRSARGRIAFSLPALIKPL